MECWQCATKLAGDFKFCPHCGTKTPEAATPETDPLRGLPPVLDPKQVARILNIHVNRLYEHMQNGDIPALKLGRRWRVSTRRLLEWLDGQPMGPGDENAGHGHKGRRQNENQYL